MTSSRLTLTLSARGRGQEFGRRDVLTVGLGKSFCFLFDFSIRTLTGEVGKT